jgi:hypothetical protein
MEANPATDSNGRDTAGRFTTGNKLSKGNPQHRRMAEARRKLHAAVSDDDLAEIVRKLVEKAKAGEPWATRYLLDQLAGRAMESISIETDPGRDEAFEATKEAFAALPEPKRMEFSRTIHALRRVGIEAAQTREGETWPDLSTD